MSEFPSGTWVPQEWLLANSKLIKYSWKVLKKMGFFFRNNLNDMPSSVNKLLNKVASYQHWFSNMIFQQDWCNIMLRGHKKFSCSSQLSMKFFLLINIKMPTNVGILIFISRKSFMLSSDVQEEPLNCWYLIFIGVTNFILSWVEHEKRFHNLRPMLW